MLSEWYRSRGMTAEVVRGDLYRILGLNRGRAPAVREAIAEGRISGIDYTGEFRCLFGTIAGDAGVDAHDIPGYSDDPDAAERFFFQIRPGDTPENSDFSRQALAWVDSFLEATCD